MRFCGRNLWTYAKIFCKLCFLRENSIYNKLLEKLRYIIDIEYEIR